MTAKAISMVAALLLGSCAGADEAGRGDPAAARTQSLRVPLERAVAAPRWIDDVVALRELFAPGEAPAVDFGVSVALAVPARLGAGAGATSARGELFVLPRPGAPLHLQLPDEADVRALRPPEEPANGEHIKLLLAREIDDVGEVAPFCDRAARASEWRRLRERLGTAGAALADLRVDFAREQIVVWVPGRGRVRAGIDLAVATEEGVDVVTATQQPPPPGELAARNAALMLLLPRRPHGLSIVGRRRDAPAGSGGAGLRETTVATFAAPD